MLHKKQNNDSRKISILGVVISAILLFGILQNYQSLFILFSLISPLSIPAYILAGILVFISLRFFTFIYTKTSKSLLSFFLTLSFYFLTVVMLVVSLFFITILYSNTISGDIIGGLFFVVTTLTQTSFLVFYLGSILLTFLIVKTIKKNPVLIATPSKLFIIISNILIITSGLLLIYLLGLLAPIAKITGIDPLCNYVYNKQIKTECLTSNYINIQGDIYKTEAGDFTVVVDNGYVNDLTVVDNKIAYTLIDRKFKDVITTVVYDGKHLGEYEYVYKLYNIGGKLVYLAQIGSSYVLFYDEKKHMNFNKSISDLVDINGKLAYAVYDRDHPYVYFNDKKYNNDFVLIDSLMAYSGQPTFRGSKNQQSYIVVGDKEYGPYEVVYDMKIEDGHLLALIKQKGEVLAFVDGKTQWMGKGYKIERNSSFVDSDNRISLINGEFSTVVYKNGNAILIVGDKEVSKVSYYDSGPYKINNKLAYISLDNKGSSQFIIDGKVKSTFNEPIYDIAVSESGKIAVKVKDDRDMFKVYINNEVVYKEDNGFIIDRFSKLKFIGDKLIFDIKKNETSLLWYNNAIIGEGYSEFKETISLNGKLLILAEKSDGNRTILLEK